MGSVRISVDKLDALITKAEELLSLKLLLNELHANMSGSFGSIREWGGHRSRLDASVRYLRERVESLGSKGIRNREYANYKNILDFLEWSREHVKRIDHDERLLFRDIDARQRHLNRMIDDFLDEVKQTAMQPFATVSDLFPGMLREIAREQGKRIHVDILGGEVEVDRRILEGMKSPLVHALRNVIDHGIEPPEVRRALGKAEEGRIVLSVKATGGHRIEIEIEDDGSGINVDALKKAAVERGLLSKAEAAAMPHDEALKLIFQSGLSTKDEVTALSGRGLGCAIIQENVEALGGTLQVKSRLGQGTTFLFRLPVSMAAFRGVLAEVGGEACVIPNTSITTVLRMRRDAIRSLEGQETVRLGDRSVPLVHLGKVLGYPPAETEESPHVVAIVIASGDKTVAFQVDQVFEELEILVKPLGSLLRRVRNVDGAAILGSGKVVPVLNARDLVRSAIAAPARFGTSQPAAGAAPARKNILVVEDSITTRTLLKTILEAEGYQVFLAVDGADGFKALQEHEVHLVVTDAEMPRLDGFALTRKIREDETLHDLPVILCTSLATQEDKERGIEAGANAYVVKGDFDQANFLDMIQRFL